MEIEAPASGFRIVCLGASITFGWGVSHAESYPARLEQELGVEVINAGAPAGDVILLAEWARKHILQLDPDLILFNVRPAYRDPQGPAQVLLQGVNILRQAAPQASLGVVMPPLSTFDLQTPDILMDYPQLGWGGEGDGQPAAEADARSTAQVLAPIPLLDLTPAFRDAQFRYRPTGDEVAVLLQRSRAHQRLVRLPSRTLLVEVPAARDGIAWQILGAFDSDASMHEPFFYDGGHPDADGYALYAREVARWVRQQGWLSQP
jgi:lysophospholipase L1-like esterase